MHKRTIWSIVATVAIVLMVSAMLPIMTAQGPLTNTMGKSAQPVNDQFGLMSNGTANTTFKQSDLVKLLSGISNPLMGAFNQSGNNVTGHYVSFSVDKTAGEIMNYSLSPAVGKNVTLLDSVKLNGLKLTGATVKGSLYAASNGSFGMAIHDNPEGTMHMASTGPASVNLTLATGLTVATMPTDVKDLKAWTITGNGVNCVLMVWNGTVTPGAAANKTTMAPGTPTSNNTTQMTPSKPSNMTTQPVCSIKMAGANTTNMTNMTGTSKTSGGQELGIALHNNSFVVLRAIPSVGSFSQTDATALSNAIVNGMVNTEVSIQSAYLKAVSVNVTKSNTTGNQTAGNMTANATVNVTKASAFVTMWSTIEYYDFSMTQVAKVTPGNVTIDIASLAHKAATNKTVSNVTANKTAGNMTANTTANQTTSNATVNMPKLWVISVNDITLGVGKNVANVSLDGKKLTAAGSMQALTSNNATNGYFMVSGTNANQFVVNIADPSVNHTLKISTFTGAAVSAAGNTTMGNTTTSNTTTGKMVSSAGASGVGAIGIGVIGLAGIAACIFVVRRKK